METTKAKLHAIERMEIAANETTIFCGECRNKDGDGWIGFEIPTNVLWGGSVLARLAVAQKAAETTGSGVGVETVDAGQKKGILLREVSADAMRDVALYLTKGAVPQESTPQAITALAGLLDYFGLLTVRCEYPPRFLRIKLREMWFRRNFYNPAFAGSALQEPLYGLHQVKSVAEVLTGAIRLRADNQIAGPSGDSAERNRETISSVFGRKKKFQLEIPPGAVDWSMPTLAAERAKVFGSAPLWKCGRQQASGSLDDPYEDLLSQYETEGRPKSPEVAPLSDSPLSQAGLFWSLELGLDSAALWSNVLLAGGAVAHCLLGLCPAAKKYDFDLFLWGMSHEQGLAKITELICALKPERVYRSKRALTLFHCEKDHRRRYQIVLRMYQSPAEILHSFDVDACCVGFDGSSALMTERARHAFDMMTNVVDFDLLSPSYESRLAKYMDRYFAVSVPGFDPAYLNCASLLSIGEECKEVQRQICKSLQGLDVLLYAVFAGHRAARSDYEETNTDASKIYKTEKYGDIPGFAGPQKSKIENLEGFATMDGHPVGEQKVWIYVPPAAEGYMVRPGHDHENGGCFTPEIVEKLVCNTPEMFGLKDVMTSRIELMTLQAGAQVTSTYHATVLANIETWYNGCFFHTEGRGNGKETLASLVLAARKAIAADHKKQYRRMRFSTWPHAWHHPVNVARRRAGIDRTVRGYEEDAINGLNFHFDLGLALGMDHDEVDGDSETSEEPSKDEE